jgi:hypothetical protein
LGVDVWVKATLFKQVNSLLKQLFEEMQDYVTEHEIEGIMFRIASREHKA